MSRDQRSTHRERDATLLSEAEQEKIKLTHGHHRKPTQSTTNASAPNALHTLLTQPPLQCSSPHTSNTQLPLHSRSPPRLRHSAAHSMCISPHLDIQDALPLTIGCPPRHPRCPSLYERPRPIRPRSLHNRIMLRTLVSTFRFVPKSYEHPQRSRSLVNTYVDYMESLEYGNHFRITITSDRS